MKISVITPNYNNVNTLKNTIDSVLNQKFDNLEYIIVDGGSTDGSIELINEYRGRVDKIIVEPDRGQYDAINKGMNVATGDILCWINSDDILLPWSLKLVSDIFQKNSDIDWIMGLPSFINTDGYFYNYSQSHIPLIRADIKEGKYNGVQYPYLQQESMFWRRSLWFASGGLNLDFKLAADFELWTRFACHSELIAIDVPLSCFRIGDGEQRSVKLIKMYEKEVQDLNNDKRNWFQQKFFVARVKSKLFRLICQYLTVRTYQEITIHKKSRSLIKVKSVGNFLRISFLTALKRGL